MLVQALFPWPRQSQMVTWLAPSIRASLAALVPPAGLAEGRRPPSLHCLLLTTTLGSLLPHLLSYPKNSFRLARNDLPSALPFRRRTEPRYAERNSFGRLRLIRFTRRHTLFCSFVSIRPVSHLPKANVPTSLLAWRLHPRPKALPAVGCGCCSGLNGHFRTRVSAPHVEGGKAN